MSHSRTPAVAPVRALDLPAVDPQESAPALLCRVEFAVDDAEEAARLAVIPEGRAAVALVFAEIRGRIDSARTLLGCLARSEAA